MSNKSCQKCGGGPVLDDSYLCFICEKIMSAKGSVPIVEKRQIIEVSVWEESRVTGMKSMRMVQTDTLVSAVRIMHTWTPKKNNRILSMTLEYVDALV